MFNLFKSKEEKQQEQIAAYIDKQMGQAERSRFEALLKQDADLQAGVEAQQEVKALLSRAPKLRAPRNFVLDPAVYGGKAPTPSFIEMLYPKMRLASAAVSFMFVILLGVGIFQAGFSAAPAELQAGDIAQLPAEAESAQSAPAEVVLTAQPPQASATQLEKLEVLSDEESAEDSAEGAVLAENYEAGPATDAPMPEMAADSVQSEPEAVEISPRVAAPPEPEGERVVDADDASAAELAPTMVPAPTQVLMEQIQVVTEEVALVQDDLQVAANKSPAVREAPAQPAFSTGAIAVWFLGLLSIALIAATIIIRRKLD